MRVIERDEVARRLTYEVCIPIVKQAMIDFSAGLTRQLLDKSLGHVVQDLASAWAPYSGKARS